MNSTKPPLKNNTSFVKPIDFSYLYVLPEAHFHTIGIALFEAFEELHLGTDLHHNQLNTLGMCTSGSLHIRINGRCYRLHPGNAIIIPPGSIYQLVDYTNDFKPLCISVSGGFMAEIISKEEKFQRLSNLTRKNALITLEPQERASLQRSYELIKSKFEIGYTYPFLKEILESLVISIFHEVYGYTLRNWQQPNSPLTKHEQLFQSFIQLVVKHHSRERMTAFYAEQLGVSPKYLAATVHNISSRSAKEWIDTHIITTARELLCTTDKSMQEIADHLNFPDQAFFCKYFKRHLKMTPKDYRKIKDRTFIP